MNKNLFESSEFYNKRLKNFATLLIWPVFVCIIGLFFFSLIGKKEVVVKATGSIRPIRTLSVVQSTSSNSIQMSHLREGKRVKCGEVLINYKNINELTEYKETKAQLSELNSQRNGLNKLKMGIKKGKNTFSSDDVYGYSAILLSYLEQSKVSQDQAQLGKNDDINKNTKIANQKRILTDLIKKEQHKRKEYGEIKDGIDKGRTVSNSNSLKYVYNSYIGKSKRMKKTEASSLKQETLSSIEATMDQLNLTISGYKLQKQELNVPENIDKVSDISKKQNDTLKQRALINVSNQIESNRSALRGVQARNKVSHDEVATDTLRAPKSGVLHLLIPDKQTIKYIPKGTEIAEIYPYLGQQKAFLVQSYLSSADIANIKRNQQMHFRLVNKDPHALSIDGRISKVGTSVVQTKDKAFFEVESVIKPSYTQRKQLRYGMQGQVDYITETKTYLQYYWDKMTS